MRTAASAHEDLGTRQRFQEYQTHLLVSTSLIADSAPIRQTLASVFLQPQGGKPRGNGPVGTPRKNNTKIPCLEIQEYQRGTEIKKQLPSFSTLGSTWPWELATALCAVIGRAIRLSTSRTQSFSAPSNHTPNPPPVVRRLLRDASESCDLPVRIPPMSTGKLSLTRTYTDRNAFLRAPSIHRRRPLALLPTSGFCSDHRPRIPPPHSPSTLPTAVMPAASLSTSSRSLWARRAPPPRHRPAADGDSPESHSSIGEDRLALLRRTFA